MTHSHLEAKISLVSADRPRKAGASLSLPDSLPTVVAEHLEREIIEGRLRPGERLLEHTWASELGISRGSFREVLRILARAGLVDIVPRRGASVAATSPKDVREIFFLRKHLMSLAAAAAAEKITDEEVETLRNIMHQMEDATGQADLLSYFRWNLAFHDTIVDIAGIGRLQDLLQYLGKSTLRYRFIGLRLPGGLSASLQANREVLDALASRDSAAASRIVFRMVERAGEVLSEALEQGEPEPPTAGSPGPLATSSPTGSGFARGQHV